LPARAGFRKKAAAIPADDARSRDSMKPGMAGFPPGVGNRLVSGAEEAGFETPRSKRLV
jgi:hypothetical protein